MLKSVLECVLVVVLCGRIYEGERLFELSDIEMGGRDGVPVQCVRVGGEEVLYSRKSLTQLVEQLAQVIARLGLGGVGPEEEGKMLALLRNIAMQYEISEQLAQARGIEADHLLAAVEQAKITKQANVKGWDHHDRLSFSSILDALTLPCHSLFYHYPVFSLLCCISSR